MDPDLGLLYFNASNPSPDFDGSARVGTNLFTNSTMALHVATGKLAWYFQAIHHDIWDWDLASGPLLFDAQVGGRTVKAIGAPGKTCYLYVWNRQTGEPINPMIETPVPTYTDVPGEQVWPTQPIVMVVTPRDFLPPRHVRRAGHDEGEGKETERERRRIENGSRPIVASVPINARGSPGTS